MTDSDASPLISARIRTGRCERPSPVRGSGSRPSRRRRRPCPAKRSASCRRGIPAAAGSSVSPSATAALAAGGLFRRGVRRGAAPKAFEPSAARRRYGRQLEPGLSAKPVQAPAECDHSAPRCAMAAWRTYRPFAGGWANGPNRPICRRCRWCRNLPLVEGPQNARRSCRRVRRPRGRRQPLTGSPATASALSVAGRGGEPTEFALDEPGEGERRPVFVFGADDLHADRQAIRDRDRNDGRRQPAGRRGIGPDQ